MEKSLSSILKSENSDVEYKPFFRCSECRETFHKPILATLTSHDYAQTYYACPHCLSKVNVVKKEKSEEKKESSILVDEVKKVVVKHEANTKCSHFLGYLKQHSKSAPFPDECFTCNRMIECLIR